MGLRFNVTVVLVFLLTIGFATAFTVMDADYVITGHLDTGRTYLHNSNYDISFRVIQGFKDSSNWILLTAPENFDINRADGEEYLAVCAARSYGYEDIATRMGLSSHYWLESAHPNMCCGDDNPRIVLGSCTGTDAGCALYDYSIFCETYGIDCAWEPANSIGAEPGDFGYVDSLLRYVCLKDYDSLEPNGIDPDSDWHWWDARMQSNAFIIHTISFD